MIEHKEHVNLLLDYYGPLLTEKQQEILRYYFADDLSLAEIAENLNISRSAVHDLIKRSEASLQRFEDELQMIANAKKTEAIYRYYQDSDSEEVQELLKKLKEIE